MSCPYFIYTAMNFFQRRKILKKANYLDLTPVRAMEHVIREDGNVSVLLPRFKNKYSSALFQPGRKSKEIHIKLDAAGSSIWLLIDGIVSVHQICIKMNALHPEKMQPTEETEKRVTGFLSLLYQQRYITFREIMDT
jgi:hypothetical protein